MALKQCPECKKEISGRAKRCPHCGFQQPRNVADTLYSIFLILILLSVGGVVIMVVVQTQKTNRAAAEFHRIADPALAAYGQIYSSPRPTQAKTLRRAMPSPLPQSDTEATLPGVVTITQSVSIGAAELPAGTRLEFVSKEGSEVHLRYAGVEYVIPISATDLK
jgi:hypothetical protein